MKSPLRSVLSFMSFGLLAQSKTKVVSPPSKDRRGESMTGDQLRALMLQSSINNTSGHIGTISIRRASRTTNQRKKRQDFRRLIAAGGA